MERNDKSYRSMFTQFVWVFSGMKRVLYGIPHPIWNFAPFIFLEGVECWLLSSVDVVGLEGYFVDVRMCVMDVEALVCRCPAPPGRPLSETPCLSYGHWLFADLRRG